MLLLLDVSGSMNEKISSGGTKFAAAKRALKQVADALPAGTDVGLRVYGSEIAESKAENPKACQDTKLVMPIGPLDRSKMYKAVDSFQAVGETPIAYSLGKAVDDLGDSGRRVLVLISDGEESCAGDPCPVARKLADKGVDLQFNAVGLDVSSKARKQLKCIAEAGNGSYYDADESDDLSEALRKITQRALRPFAITGTKVTGTESPDGAPELTAGQFQDRFGADGGERYYRTRATARRDGDRDGQQPRPAHRLVQPRGLALHVDHRERYSLRRRADAERDRRRHGGRGSGAVVSGVEEPTCTTEPLVLAVERRGQQGSQGGTGPRSSSPPNPRSPISLPCPRPVSSYKQTGSAVPGKKPVRRVVGGSSFTNAPLLTPGSFTDAPAVGESIFYKIRLETGQRLRTTVTAPSDRDGWDLTSTETVTVASLIYTPSRVPLTKQSGVLQGDNRQKLTANSPQVRVRNREIPHGRIVGTEGDPLAKASYASVAGEYYVSVQARQSTEDTSGRVLPIRLDLAVEGTASGQPEYATAPSPSPSASAASPTATPSASADPGTAAEGGQNAGALVIAAGVGAGVVALLGLVGWLVIRRSRSSRPGANRNG